VDHDAKTTPKARPQFLANFLPGSLELMVGNAPVCDREMVPIHVPSRDLSPEVRDLQSLKFVVLDQSDDSSSVPLDDRVEIKAEVTGPRSRERAHLPLAWAQRYAKLPVAPSRLNFGDLQRMTATGAHQLAPFTQEKSLSP
jgi:hypothetical protein